jgi:hypothetical protein
MASVTVYPVKTQVNKKTLKYHNPRENELITSPATAVDNFLNPKSRVSNKQIDQFVFNMTNTGGKRKRSTEDDVEDKPLKQVRQLADPDDDKPLNQIMQEKEGNLKIVERSNKWGKTSWAIIGNQELTKKCKDIFKRNGGVWQGFFTKGQVLEWWFSVRSNAQTALEESMMHVAVHVNQ